jgi:REP element-mobilizing transposase RayT
MRTRSMKKTGQLEFAWPAGHGGVRKGAGRKRKGTRNRVSHGQRESLFKSSGSKRRGCKRRVLHVTCRIKEGLPSLRRAETVRLLMALLARVCEKEGFRIVEFSIQCNHIHLLCEAEDQTSLSSAMNGILSGMARMLNRHWGRKGKVFEDRYHAEAITSPTQCRHVLNYLLHYADYVIMPRSPQGSALRPSISDLEHMKAA